MKTLNSDLLLSVPRETQPSTMMLLQQLDNESPYYAHSLKTLQSIVHLGSFSLRLLTHHWITTTECGAHTTYVVLKHIDWLHGKTHLIQGLIYKTYLKEELLSQRILYYQTSESFSSLMMDILSSTATWI